MTGITSRCWNYGESSGLGPLIETVPLAAKVGKRVIILGNSLIASTSVTSNGTPAIIQHRLGHRNHRDRFPGTLKS